MITINRQDILKTVLIIWFIATTGYVVYDQYAGYKLRGLQQAYQAGYATASGDIIKKAKENQCLPFEISDGSNKAALINNICLTQKELSDFSQSQAAAKK